MTYEKVRDATHPDDLPRTAGLARSALDPAVRAKEPYEYRIKRADTGEERWVLAHGEAVFADIDGAPKAVRYLGTIEDITCRKATELALRESELRQRLALEAARMAVWELDVAKDAIVASSELSRIYGLPADTEPTLDQLRPLYAPGERERVQEIGRKAIEEGKSHFEAEYRIRRPDGNLAWLLLRAEIISDDGGNIKRVIGVVMDIDERKRSEERQMLLMRELTHRVKNSLSVIQSIAAQSFRGDRADPEALAAFRGRLVALAEANEVLLGKDWSGFSLSALVHQIVKPYRDPQERIEILGQDLHLPARLNAPLALILHELCTNAAKYGALSAAVGRVRIGWRKATARSLNLHWIETGGPPIGQAPAKGFGLKLICDVLAVQIGKVRLVTGRKGLACKLVVAV